MHQGVVPNVNLTMATGLAHQWDHQAHCWRPVIDVTGKSSDEQIYIAGDGGGIGGAKAAAIALAEKGYRPPSKEKKVKVLGNQILGSFLVGADSMLHAGFITEHEKLMSEKLGYVMSGGDLSQPTMVSEQYLLDIEREAFLSLTGERKTLERIEHMLKTGKPLRN